MNLSMRRSSTFIQFTNRRMGEKICTSASNYRPSYYVEGKMFTLNGLSVGKRLANMLGDFGTTSSESAELHRVT